MISIPLLKTHYPEDMTLFVLNGSYSPDCTPRKMKILSTVIVGGCVYEYESVSCICKVATLQYASVCFIGMKGNSHFECAHFWFHLHQW